jgi:hypothetical protein
MRLLTEYQGQNIDELESVLGARSAPPPQQIDESNLPARVRYASSKYSCRRNRSASGCRGAEVAYQTALRQVAGVRHERHSFLRQTLNMKLKRLSMRPNE